jgi:transposase
MKIITSYNRRQNTKIHYLNKQSPSFKASCPVKKEQLELLVNQGMTMKQIGEQLNVSINTIRKWFNTFKVETPYQKNRKITETIDLQEFSRLIELGTSKQKIIEKLNITKDIYVTLLKNLVQRL